MNIEQALASGISGFSPSQLAAHLPPGVEVPRGDPPFSEQALRERGDSHLLIPVLPIAILDLLGGGAGRPCALGRPLYYHGQWWYDEPSLWRVSREPLLCRWMLLNRQPFLYGDASREQCTRAEDPHLGAPYERTLSAREALYALLACEVARASLGTQRSLLDLPDRDYVVLGFEDHEECRPGPHTIWNTGTGLILNVMGSLPPLRKPHYGLSEYLEVGDLYEDKAKEPGP